VRGLSRRKSALAIKRALSELPEDDGKIPILMRDRCRVFWGLVTPEAIHDHAAQVMALHDARERIERWGGNQWGEEWVQKPYLRTQFAIRMPLLKTDPSYKDWCRAIRRSHGRG